MNAAPYCPRCGAVNTSEAESCFACGQNLADTTASALNAPEGNQRLLRQRYLLLRQIGSGGFGAVYKAEDTQLGNRLVAIKEMSARSLTSTEQAEATGAFHREALLLAGLAHPHLPRIYEQFEENGHWYLVMDFIDGQTLEAYLTQRGGRLPVKEALQLGLQLTSVLGYLHTRQPPIIFRDLKPSNVMRTSDGQVYLIDFGIARLFKPGQTRDTIAFGSPGYAAPEQYGKTQTTPRSDVYSLGALLHHLITGIDPADKPFRFAPLTMRRPMGLSTLLQRMVEMEPEKRPASMEIVQRDLGRLASEQVPWHGDDPALTGFLPRATRTLTSTIRYAAPLTAPPGPPPAWPQTRVVPAPPPGPNRAARRLRLLFWVGLPLLLFVGLPLLFSALGSLGSDPQPENTATPVPSGTAPTKTTGTPTPNVRVYTLAWSPDGREVASAGDDTTIQIWNAVNGKPTLQLRTDFSQIASLAWSPNGSELAATGDKTEYQIWRANGTLVGTFQIDITIDTLAWSPDNISLALACADGTVRVVNTQTQDTSIIYKGLYTLINALAWSPDGSSLVFGGDDGTARIWDFAAQKIGYLYQGSSGAITALAWSHDGSNRIALADGAQVVVWNPLADTNPFPYTGSQSRVNSLAWSSDGKYLAAGENNGAVAVWAVSQADPLRTFTKHADLVRAVAWSPLPGQQIIASGSNDGTVLVWNALTGSISTTYHQP